MCQAQQPYQVTSEELEAGLEQLKADSLPALRAAMPGLRAQLSEPSTLKEV